MNRKTIYYTILIIIIFVGLVLYNYISAQRSIFETKPSPLGITLESYPEVVVAGQTGSFMWDINSSPDLTTSKTTIFWDYSSSPSALTVSDTPEAVRYSHSLDDYTKGVFQLPDSFDLSIKFDKIGKVYFRAYAKVGNNNLWSDEKTIEVVSSSKDVIQ